MASPAPSTSQSSGQTILIHVVSPSSEVSGRLTFPDVLITETIADLKRRIQQTVPSKPALERQRIIYRGRALMHHELTLQSVLGSEVSNASNPFTFHLVLSPTDSTAPNVAPRADGLHQPIGLPALPIHTLGASGLNMPPRPASTSQVPEGGQQAIHHNHNIPFNPLLNMFPPGLQPGPGVDIRMQFTQMGRPFYPPNMPPGVNMPGTQVPLPTTGPGMPSSWPQDPLLAMSQQQMHQMHQQIHHNMLNRGQNQMLGGPEMPNQVQQTSRPQSRDPSTVRETTDNQGPQIRQVPSPTPTTDGSVLTSRQLPTMRQYPAGGMPGLSSMAAANLHAIRQNHLQNMQLDQMSQFTQLRNALINPFQSPRSSISLQSTQTVYLLSSPRGPEALLLSPSGTFTTGGHGINPHASLSNSGWGSIAVTNVQTSQAANPAPGPVPGAGQTAAQQQQQQEQQQDQAGDLVRILLPLGGHLWLLVRLFGFVYLFSGGRGWRNTILLGAIALIGFLAQTGLFNPLVRNVWRPIREHVEGIIHSEHPRSHPANGQMQTPQELADRLLQRQVNESSIRRTARRVERSVILFAASLIPGVGESQVRAREAAEREQREAEEAAERARQEAEQQAQNEELQSPEEKHTEVETKENNIKNVLPSTTQEEQIGID